MQVNTEVQRLKELQTENEYLKAVKGKITQLEKQVAQLQTENQILKEKLEAVGVTPLKKGEVIKGKVFKEIPKIPGWKVALSSYEILEGGGIKFNFVIENLQAKPADFRFYSHVGKQKHIRPYILDDQTNKYYDAKVFPPDDVTLMPNTPVEGYITFTQSKLEKAKVIIFYFGFEGENIEGGGKNILICWRWAL